ncbi:MAG: hypothetical protein ACD_7C00207G0002 [uncultured bacterium]|nr:MAG: hypothetical protein ACD_7C00207G0002 [uncultured bacterium]
MIKYFYLFYFLASAAFAKYQGIEDMNIDISNIEMLIDHKEIKSKIFQTVQKIDEDYKNEEIVVLMLLKGSIIFASDFIRELKTPFTLETITCSSYGLKGTQRGGLTIQGLEKLNLESKNVLIIDDIFDSGNTLSNVRKEILKKNPKSVKSVVLLLKDTPKRLKNVELPEYFLFEIEDKFVIGYGLDYKEYLRGLKDIYFIR